MTLPFPFIFSKSDARKDVFSVFYIFHKSLLNEVMNSLYTYLVWSVKCFSDYTLTKICCLQVFLYGLIAPMTKKGNDRPLNGMQGNILRKTSERYWNSFDLYYTWEKIKTKCFRILIELPICNSAKCKLDRRVIGYNTVPDQMYQPSLPKVHKQNFYRLYFCVMF